MTFATQAIAVELAEMHCQGFVDWVCMAQMRTRDMLRLKVARRRAQPTTTHLSAGVGVHGFQRRRRGFARAHDFGFYSRVRAQVRVLMGAH